MSQQLLTLKILSPDGIILTEESLYAVNAPLADGFPIGIRPGHAPLIAETEQGIVHYRNNKGKRGKNLHAGVLEIRDNQIIILTTGEVSKISPEITQRKESEYDRLMNTLIEKFSLDME